MRNKNIPERQKLRTSKAITITKSRKLIQVFNSNPLKDVF